MYLHLKRMICDGGEKNTAIAAKILGVCFIESFFSESSMQEINMSAKNGLQWKNIYPFNECVQENVLSLINKAETNGKTALGIYITLFTLS